MMRFKFILLIPAISAIMAYSQDNKGLMIFDEQQMPQYRKIIAIPDVEGFTVLKCDFHMHTVFSDGTVWPSVRLMEAWKEGLDAISITDHVEGHPHSKEVIPDNNRPFELVTSDAKKNKVLLIKGAEITRSTPPGHFNALFIGDASEYITDRSTNERDREAILKASAQGAFIFWNHPGWKTNIEGSYEWIDFVEDLYKSKMLHGIEVFNGFGFHMKALDWCIDKGLTVIGSSDSHSLVREVYDMSREYGNRTMTLLFAKDRSEASVREALDKGRTVAWAGKYLAGEEENVRKLFDACIELKPRHHSDIARNGKPMDYYEVSNKSDLYFELELNTGIADNKIKLFPRSSQVIAAEHGQTSLVYEVVTAFVRSDKHLSTEFKLK
jgi:predicted metal-dependent phosphoesterase TrpH